MLLALLGALFIGVSDFLGGLASHKSHALTVSLVVQLIGLLTLAPIAAVLGASALTLRGRSDLFLGKEEPRVGPVCMEASRKP